MQAVKAKKNTEEFKSSVLRLKIHIVSHRAGVSVNIHMNRFLYYTSMLLWYIFIIWIIGGVRGLHINAHKTEYMCFNQRGDISTQNGSSLKLVDKFTYPGSSVSSTETDINTWLAKIWTAFDRLSVTWKSDQTNKMKCHVSILLYGCTTWSLTKRMEKKLNDNYTRMLRAILNKSWRQHPTKQQLYGHLPPITKTIQVRWTRLAGHC